MHRYALSLASCSIVLLLNTPIWTAEIPNGIYRVVEEGQGKLTDRSSGGPVNLGERVSENFGEVSIWSTSNQNDRYRVWMKGAVPAGSRRHLAIYVEGVCEVISSYGSSEGSDKVDLSAEVSGAENAQKIASGLNIKVIERKHPGYQFAIHWKPMKEEFKPGEPIELELTIRNVGEVTVYFMEGGQNRGSRDNQFGFTAFSGSGYWKAIPDTGDPNNFGGLAGFRALKQGESFRKQIDITKWVKFEKADSYQITGMYELEFHNADFDSQVIWEDFVTGRCLVRIVE